MWYSNQTAHTFFGLVRDYENAHDCLAHGLGGTGHGDGTGHRDGTGHGDEIGHGDETGHEVAGTDPWAESDPCWDPDIAFSHSVCQACHQIQDQYYIACACYQTGSSDLDQKSCCRHVGENLVCLFHPVVEISEMVLNHFGIVYSGRVYLGSPLVYYLPSQPSQIFLYNSLGSDCNDAFLD
jgi:hypothetical protein